MEPNYSPFSKQLDDVTTEDLASLKTVHEGWYVEYKEAVPNPQSIAKSVSAFANTFGGFLFYGIQEKSKQDNVAGEFIGILKTDVEAMRERIRQAICAHSSPEPYFVVRVFDGPQHSIGLGADRAIICVHIPQSYKAPHVHKSGVIYRRVADSSEPSAENDRHALGELFGRSNKMLERYRNWFDSDPKFSDGEAGQPFLRVLVNFDPWKERNPWLDLRMAEIRELLNPRDKPAALPFDTIFPMRGGYIARQTIGNDVSSLTLTLAVRCDLTSEMLIPIPFVQVEQDHELRSQLEGYEFADKFYSVIASKKYSSLRLLDLNQIYPILYGAFESLERIASAAEWTHGMSVTFKVLNADRSCPFLDIKTVVDRYEKDGVPVLMSIMSSLRESHHPNAFFELRQVDDEGEPLGAGVHAGILMMHIAHSLGIPMWELLDTDSGLLNALGQAGGRSMAAQAIRNRITLVNEN